MAYFPRAVVERQKPAQWTQEEFDRINDEEHTVIKTTQAELKSLLERAGTLLKVLPAIPYQPVLYFEDIVISTCTDGRDNGIIAEQMFNEHGKLVEYKLIFTHPDNVVSSWISADELRTKEGRPIYHLRVYPSRDIMGNPAYDSDTDDDQYQRDLNLFAESTWSRLKSDNPLVVTFRLPS